MGELIPLVWRSSSLGCGGAHPRGVEELIPGVWRSSSPGCGGAHPRGVEELILGELIPGLRRSSSPGCGGAHPRGVEELIPGVRRSSSPGCGGAHPRGVEELILEVWSWFLDHHSSQRLQRKKSTVIMIAETEVFEITDFTTASEWERFVSKLEEVLNDWKLIGNSSRKPAPTKRPLFHRSALEQKEEQFRSFKDRVAENVLLSSTTENTENMNSPVNRSRLTEMYQQLRVCVWPHINWTQPEHRARYLVQEVFSRAHENMTKSLSTVCAGSTSSPQVDTFRRRALENLQMVLLHSSKQQVCVKAFPSLSGPELDLASECYWLGCLMALHSPPLHPDWDRGSGLVFPRDIREIRTKR
uniref:Rab3 GTPase-activating protein catalytic subunit n=1 Tax=Knipowitschia caucasica TaxID=637954 RepID=A0AAV2JXF0_KNICA